MFEFFAAHIGAVALGVGGLGGVALVALIFVGGVPAAGVIAAAIGFLKETVKFFQTPVGQAVGVVLLCFLCLLIGDVHATRREVAARKTAIDRLNTEWKAKVDEASAKFAAARTARDSDVDAKVGVLVQKRLTEIAEQTAALQKLETPDATDPKDCVLRPSDLDDGLRHRRK